MSRPHALLTRAPHQARPALSVMGELSFAQMRVHELCGRARRTLALMIAAQAGAPGIWIAPGRIIEADRMILRDGAQMVLK